MTFYAESIHGITIIKRLVVASNQVRASPSKNQSCLLKNRFPHDKFVRLPTKSTIFLTYPINETSLLVSKITVNSNVTIIGNVLSLPQSQPSLPSSPSLLISPLIKPQIQPNPSSFLFSLESISLPSMAMAGEPPSTSTGFLGLLSFRRHQIASLEPTPQDELDTLEHFQSRVSSHLLSLLSCDDSSAFLSLSFLSKLLDSLLCIEHEFRALLPLLLSRNPSILSKPPSDKLTNELLDRAVKSLDLCNAVSLSLQAMRHLHRQARIAASCLLQSEHLGEAQMSRARRALKKLLAGAFNRTGSSGSGFGGSTGGSGSSLSRDASFLHSKSLSFSVSKNWSAKQQVQAMSAHLAAPRQATVTDAASGLAMAVYTMSSFLVFVMWVLVSAVPCYDRVGTNNTTTPPPPPPPKHLQWAVPMATLQEKITEEWKRKDKRASGILLAEMQAVEKSARWLMEWVEEGVEEGGPLIEEDRAAEVAARAVELEESCDLLEEGLEPFERQVRAVFHRVVSSRAEVIRYLDDSMRSTRAHGQGNAGLPPLHGAGLPPMP